MTYHQPRMEQSFPKRLGRVQVPMVILLLMVGCTPVKKTVEYIPVGLVACDWGQTLYNSERNWRTHYEENPILGKEPSPERVNVYFTIVTDGMMFLNEMLPEKVKWPLLGVITVAEISTIKSNMDNGASLCGL